MPKADLGPSLADVWRAQQEAAATSPTRAPIPVWEHPFERGQREAEERRRNAQAAQAKALELGCPQLPELALYIVRLEERIAALEAAQRAAAAGATGAGTQAGQTNGLR